MGKKFGIRMNSIILMMILLLGAFIVVVPGTAISPQVGDYTYTLSGSPAVAIITGYTGNGGAITIPSNLGGNTVIAIGENAFNNYNGHLVTSVIIPSSVAVIEDFAFFYCRALTSVTIGSGVNSIGSFTFGSCASLTHVDIPDSVTTIGGAAFIYCTNLTSVTIGSGVYLIDSSAFSECWSLTHVEIPDSVTTIGDNAFLDCFSLTSVTIGSGVTAIGASAFRDCTSLTSITFLGLTAPIIVGNYWIDNTDWAIMGHAYADSNFPATGEAWNGLTMGDVLPEPVSPSSDSTMLYLAIGIAAVVVVIAVIVVLMRKKN
jgi:hypothetical protein